MKSTSNSNSSSLLRYMDRIHEKRVADDKVKLEVAKIRLEQQLKQREKNAELRSDPKNAQLYSPEQQFLRRRLQEQNPLSAIDLPTSDEPMNGVMMPSSEVTQDSSSGIASEAPLDTNQKAQYFLQKVDQMVAAGKQPHPAVMKIADLMRQNLARNQQMVQNKALGIKNGGPGQEGKYTGADAKAVSDAEALTSKLIKLKEMVGTPDENYLPLGGGSKGGQEFQTLKDDVANTLLYLKSGSAVSPQEYKRLNGLLPKLFRYASVDKNQLDRFIGEFSSIQGRIKEGRKYDEKSGKFSTQDGVQTDETADTSNTSDEEDFSYLWGSK